MVLSIVCLFSVLLFLAKVSCISKTTFAKKINREYSLLKSCP